MKKEWSNWSGNLRFTPDRIETPENEEDLVKLVQRTAAENLAIRTVGSEKATCSVLLVRRQKPRQILQLERSIAYLRGV
jgi:hypothetical protein